jgi:hypothetical protein
MTELLLLGVLMGKYDFLTYVHEHPRRPLTPGLISQPLRSINIYPTSQGTFSSPNSKTRKKKIFNYELFKFYFLNSGCLNHTVNVYGFLGQSAFLANGIREGLFISGRMGAVASLHFHPYKPLLATADSYSINLYKNKSWIV